MDAVIEQTFCGYCKHFGPKKYHNVTVAYCSECNIDVYGSMVYTCGYCGLKEPQTRMETETACKSCWNNDTAA